MNKSILYIGPLFEGSTAVHRLTAIKNIFDTVYSINQQIVKNRFLLLFDRLLNKIIYSTLNEILLNKKVMSATGKIPTDIIWIDKGLQMKPATIKILKNKFPYIKIIHYSPDDMFNPNNQTNNYLNCIPLYDLHVTTKSYNVAELYYVGAKKVIFVNNAYAPEVHKPYTLTAKEKEKYSSDVSFIGGPEKERAESINWLAKNGIYITVWGKGWEKYLTNNPNIVIKSGWFPDEEYCKIICATKINIAFLRKVNRDLQTTRTMEIPACGGFMLAERTDEHMELFKEDEEAAFFSDNEELKRKIVYYLENENERKVIALGALKRCKDSGYDNITMVKKVFKCLI